MSTESTISDQVLKTMLEAQREDNRLQDMELHKSCSSPLQVYEDVGLIPRLPHAYSFARGDKSSEIADGDRAKIYETKVDQVKYFGKHHSAAESITKRKEKMLNDLAEGGFVDKLTTKVARQVCHDDEMEWAKIPLGTGTAAKNQLADVIALPSGDEFNAASPAKTPEAYIKEARTFTGGSACLMCEDVLFALLENPNLAENGLNQRSMTEAELMSWFAARGISEVHISRAKHVTAPPEQDPDVEYMLAGMFAIGQTEAIRRAWEAELHYINAKDPLAEAQYIAARSDMGFVIGHPRLIRAFTNTLA